jgi:hypothetical protein
VGVKGFALGAKGANVWLDRWVSQTQSKAGKPNSWRVEATKPTMH